MEQKCVLKYRKIVMSKASYKFNLYNLAQGRKPPVGISKTSNIQKHYRMIRILLLAASNLCFLPLG